MKIAMLSSNLSDKVYSGSNIYTERLTCYLPFLKDIDLHIITVGNENKLLKNGDITIHVIKQNKIFCIPYFHPVLIWKIKRKIEDIDPDIVHAISTSFLYSTVTTFIKDKYPTILTAFGIRAKEAKYYIYDFTKFHLLIFTFFGIVSEKYVLTKIPNIIVDTVSIKNLVSKWTKSNIYIVPAGIEYKHINEIKSDALLNENPDIFFVNNLIKLKGADILIKALSIVVKSIPNISVCIAGIGPREHELRCLVKRLNLEDQVNLVGFISEGVKYQYYKACKIVVVPSRWDCQPFALFDAAAASKPVIASDMSNPGIVENGVTGFIFKSENFEDLARKIIILLNDDKLREDMGNAAKDRVKQYDWNKVAKRYVEIYKEVIANFQRD